MHLRNCNNRIYQYFRHSQLQLVETGDARRYMLWVKRFNCYLPLKVATVVTVQFRWKRGRVLCCTIVFILSAGYARFNSHYVSFQSLRIKYYLYMCNYRECLVSSIELQETAQIMCPISEKCGGYLLDKEIKAV